MVYGESTADVCDARPNGQPGGQETFNRNPTARPTKNALTLLLKLNRVKYKLRLV
jgi:hypothetical protein